MATGLVKDLKADYRQFFKYIRYRNARVLPAGEKRYYGPSRAKEKLKTLAT